MKRQLAVIVIPLTLLSACSSHKFSLAANGPYFAGLDPSVAAEVVGNPSVVDRLKGEPDDTKASMAQGIARNFSVCRDVYRVVHDWRRTGQLQALSPLPKPSQAIEPSNKYWDADYARLIAMVETADLESLTSFLTGTGGCGSWIPLKPGDVGGQTIKAAVEAIA